MARPRSPRGDPAPTGCCAHGVFPSAELQRRHGITNEVAINVNTLRRLARLFVNLGTGQGVLSAVKSAGDQDPAVL